MIVRKVRGGGRGGVGGTRVSRGGDALIKSHCVQDGLGLKARGFQGCASNVSFGSKAGQSNQKAGSTVVPAMSGVYKMYINFQQTKKFQNEILLGCKQSTKASDEVYAPGVFHSGCQVTDLTGR